MINKISFYSKKKIIPVFLAFILTGCFTQAKFDSTNEDSIKESTQKIIDGLPEESRNDFKKALLYFYFGEKDRLNDIMGKAFTGISSDVIAKEIFYTNLKVIDGLNGKEIIENYFFSIEKENIKLEKDIIKKEKEKEEINKIINIENEAKKLLENNKFEEAILKYKSLSEISSGVELAKLGIEKTTKAMEEFTEKMNYIGNIEIKDFIAKRINTYSKNNIPAIRISLKNNGNRSLDEVKIVVYFKDKYDKIIFEENYHPIFVSKYLTNNKPLKAGYIQEMNNNNYYTLESELSDWDEGNAVAKIVDIEFTK